MQPASSIKEISSLCETLETQYSKLNNKKDVKTFVTSSGKILEISIGKRHFINRLVVWYHTQIKKDYLSLEDSLLSTVEKMESTLRNSDIWQSPTKETLETLGQISGNIEKIHSQMPLRDTNGDLPDADENLQKFAVELSKLSQEVFNRLLV